MFRRNWGALSAAVVAVAAVAGTAVLGSLYTQQSVSSSWYARIQPWFAPPSWVFPVVWTSLYVALAIAFTQSLVGDPAFLTLFHVANLTLNVVWCAVFFGRRDPRQAIGILVGNVGVAVAIATGTRIALVRQLLTPYIAWLIFATALNAAAITKT
jgi:benzodiazapine receptor